MRVSTRAVLGVLGACIFIAACDDTRGARRRPARGSAPGEFTPSGIADNAATTAWQVEGPSLVRPFAVHLLSDTLALVLDYGYPFLHLIDVNRGEYVGPVTLPADSAGELPSVYRIAVAPGTDPEFAGYDRITNSITRYRFRELEHPLERLEVIKLRSIEAVDAPVWHSDGRISVEPYREGTLRAVVSSDGTLTGHSGLALSSLAPEWVTPAIWRDAMDGNTCPSPDRTRLARTWTYLGQLYVLDSAGNKLPGVRYERFFDADFVVRNTGEVVFAPQGADVRNAYRSCGTTGSYVFALFSGQLARPTGRGRPVPATQVHVYDWNGRLYGGFRLPRDAVAMDVTSNGRLLIAVDGSRGGQPSVSAYEVPRKFRTRARSPRSMPGQR